MSTLTVTQEGIIQVLFPAFPTETYVLQAPAGAKWDLVANGTTGSLTASDGSPGTAASLILFDPNETPWSVTIDDGGILTVKSFDQDIVLAPAVNAPVSIEGVPAVDYELFVTDSVTGLGAATYKNGLFVSTQPSPIILDDFGLPKDPIYIIVGNTYTFQLKPPGGGSTIKTWAYVVGGIPINTESATEWGNALDASHISASSFSLQGDARTATPIARRVQVTDASTLYGTVTSVVYDGSLTVVTLSLDAGSLSTGLQSVRPSLLTPRSSPIPARRYGGTATTFSGSITIPAGQGLNLLPAGYMALYPNPGVLPPPPGWLQCNGQAVSRTTYANLFAAVGTTYGVGNGTTTFNVPSIAAVGSLVYYIYAKG